MTKNQTHGRGQRQNTWLSEPNSNITFSFVLYPSQLNPQQHFTLNMLISIGIIDWLKSLNVSASIKWPNDILIGTKKIAGILIENTVNSTAIKQAIIGIGVNVNQKEFPEELLSTASSILKETGLFLDDLESNCLQLLTHIFTRYQQLLDNSMQHKELLEEYNQQLFRIGVPAKYHADNTTFEATLLKVDENGLLYLAKDEGIVTYYFKEVVFIMQ